MSFPTRSSPPGLRPDGTTPAGMILNGDRLEVGGSPPPTPLTRPRHRPQFLSATPDPSCGPAHRAARIAPPRVPRSRAPGRVSPSPVPSPRGRTLPSPRPLPHAHRFARAPTASLRSRSRSTPDPHRYRARVPPGQRHRQARADIGTARGASAPCSPSPPSPAWPRPGVTEPAPPGRSLPRPRQPTAHAKPCARGGTLPEAQHRPASDPGTCSTPAMPQPPDMPESLAARHGDTRTPTLPSGLRFAREDRSVRGPQLTRRGLALRRLQPDPTRSHHSPRRISPH